MKMPTAVLAALMAGVLALTLPISVLAQAGGGGSVGSTLVARFDLDGAAASATAIHSADTITDSASFTIDAQPDTPRVLAATLTDADTSISACVLTVVGTKADGTSATATTNLTGGSGVKTLAPVVNFATVTSSSVGVCTGEGVGDTVSLGTTSALPVTYVGSRELGRRTSQGNTIYNSFSWRQEKRKVVNEGGVASANLDSATASSGAFQYVGVGTIILLNVQGTLLERVVTVKTDNDNITLDASVDLTPVSGGVGYNFRTQFIGPDAEDGWIGVGNLQFASFVVNIVSMTGTGGINLSPECRYNGANTQPVVVTSDGLVDNVATAGNVVFAVDLRLTAYDQCRFGLEWATNDDDDTGVENINVVFVGTVR